MSLPSSRSSTSLSTSLSASSHSVSSSKGIDDDKPGGSIPSPVGFENVPGPSNEDNSCQVTKKELEHISQKIESEDETTAEESEVLIYQFI